MVQLSSSRLVVFVLSALMVGSFGPRARAQASVTQADIQRLQEGISTATKDIAQARTRDAALADQLQRELDDVRDQTTYLKVKLQRNEPIARSDYSDLRDRIDNIRDRARGEGSGGYTPPPAIGVAGEPPPSGRRAPNEIPVGTEFDVRIQSALSSATSMAEDRFDATTLVDLQNEHGQVLVPAGSVMRGIVSSVTKATRTERTGKLTVAFDQVTIDHRSYPIRATVTQAIESEGIKGEAGKIGVGAGVGAILGAILGGGKGALAGILIGGGGTIVATEGKDVELPAGTVLRVRLDSPLTVER
ncbi:MAG TPA: hypothetical protein VF219_20360 [Vicinamibacterales bacterium]